MRKQTVLVLLYFILATLYATFPLVFHLTDALPHDGDELFITWVLQWNIHSFLTNPLGIYDTNIFYPFHNTLAYSETFLTTSILGLIPYILFHQPTATYNCLLMFAYMSLGFCTYLLVRYITTSAWAGIIGGTLVAFSTYTITKTMHLQLVGIALVPLSILFFLQYADSKKKRYLFLVFLCFFLQVANSFLPAYFILFSLLFVWGSFYFSDKKKFYLFLKKKVFIFASLTLIAIIPLVLPYLSVSKQFHYQRDIRDAIHFANRLEYTFYPTDKTRLHDLLMQTVYSHDKGPFTYDGYVGLPFFVLFFFTLYYYVCKKKKRIPYLNSFFYLGWFSFLLSLGPAFQWGGRVIKLPFIIPLPYALLYYILPGFNGMRNSGRWEMLFLFSFCVVIGIVLANIFKKISQKVQIGITVIICIIVLWEIPLPMRLTPIPPKEKIPQTYYYVNTLPQNSVVAEMPSYVWYMAPFANQEVYREYYATIDFRKRINGASGFSPIVWEEYMRDLLINFPNDTSIQHLRKLGVTTIIVHTGEYNTLFSDAYILSNHRIPNGITVITELRKNKKVKLKKQIGFDYIYTLQ